jgi:hypothetical protein
MEEMSEFEVEKEVVRRLSAIEKRKRWLVVPFMGREIFAPDTREALKDDVYQLPWSEGREPDPDLVVEVYPLSLIATMMKWNFIREIPFSEAMAGDYGLLAGFVENGRVVRPKKEGF